MIMAAYGVFQEDMISGLPKWAETDRFDIVAKAPENTPPATLWLMLQSLLADRFQLQIHYEEKMRQAYVLTRGKRPLKLEPSTARQTCNWTQVEGGLMRRQCQGMTMAEFTRSMPGLGGVGINRPVVDETGLNGAYDFHFAVGFANRGKGDGVRAGENPVAASAADSSEMDGPTIFTALDEIGLKLESRKMPLKTIVIDRVVRPSVN